MKGNYNVSTKVKDERDIASLVLCYLSLREREKEREFMTRERLMSEKKIKNKII